MQVRLQYPLYYSSSVVCGLRCRGPMCSGPMVCRIEESRPMYRGPMCSGPMVCRIEESCPMCRGPMCSGPMACRIEESRPMCRGPPMCSDPMVCRIEESRPMCRGPMCSDPMVCSLHGPWPEWWPQLCCCSDNFPAPPWALILYSFLSVPIPRS